VSQDSYISTMVDYRWHDSGSSLRRGRVSLCDHVQTSSEAHPAFCPMGASCSFLRDGPEHEVITHPGGKVKNVWSSPSTFSL
jgi:hypothetical protein